MVSANAFVEENDDADTALLSPAGWRRTAGCSFWGRFAMRFDRSVAMRACTMSPSSSDKVHKILICGSEMEFSVSNNHWANDGMQCDYVQRGHLLRMTNIAAVAYGLVTYCCQLSFLFNELMGHSCDVGNFLTDTRRLSIIPQMIPYCLVPA